MKTNFTLILAILLFSFSAFATSRTVSNDPNNPAQYNNLQTAINAASAGDTIYIQATYVTIQGGQVQNGGSNYGNITVNKRLVLIGSGYNPNQDIAYVSTVGNVTFDTTTATVGVPASGASGSVISGLIVWGSIGTSGNYNNTFRANNITIQRCWITSTVYMYNTNNTVIQQNVMAGGNNNGGPSTEIGNTTNIVIRNNIFAYQISTYPGSNPVNCIITNNNFIGYVTSANTASYAAFSSYYATFTNAIITNNIFYAVDPTGVSNSTFNNNITFADANPTLPGSSNIGSGNLVNTNPQFTSYPLGSAWYNTTQNFQLAAGSPGKNAGTDGTDIGIYGGIGFVATGAPNVPYIEHFVISNSSISVGQNLNVTIEAKAQK